MSALNQRIKRIIADKNVSGRQAASDMEIDYRQFNNWLNDVKPSVEGLQKIIKYCPAVDARWLLTGEVSAGESRGYSANQEFHESNADDGGGGYACTNPACKNEIALLNRLIRQQEETLELYRNQVKKETGASNSVQFGKVAKG